MPRGLGALPALAEAKLSRLRRLVLAGMEAGAEDFASCGFDLSRSEQDEVAAWQSAGLDGRVIESVNSADGSERLVIELSDGESIETVVMADDSVCVSTQVGCAVGCRFCASGLEGLQRNLEEHEILEQVVHARRRRPDIDRVVYMGIGEPTHNFDAVLAAGRYLREDGGIPDRRQTLSTVGSTRAFERLTEAGFRLSLAVSLHSADDGRRRQLLPNAGRESLQALVASAERYGSAIGRPPQYAWALLAGVNDSDRDIDELAALLRGTAGYVNLIPWNQVEGLPFTTPSPQRAVTMVRELRRRGVLATLRHSAGADVAAACGQLRRRGNSR